MYVVSNALIKGIGLCFFTASLAHAGIADWTNTKTTSETVPSGSSSVAGWITNNNANGRLPYGVTGSSDQPSNSQKLEVAPTEPEALIEYNKKNNLISVSKVEEEIAEIRTQAQANSPSRSAITTDIAPSPSLEAPVQIDSASFGGMPMGDQAHSFMQQGQDISNRINGLARQQNLDPGAQLALSLFNAALMGVGIESVTEAKISDASLAEYNASAGCVNSNANPVLLQLAKSALNQFSNIADLREILSRGVVIGGPIKQSCRGV